ncbi:hypothetical protein OHI65_08545 [Brucella sp. MAB-22]|uniref:hypothetical protein n=1 Tax=Brucella TaxID=234 RepID=UPI000F668406|nr:MULTISPECIES: hypothetical protein [Brucella]RRY16439.1 hypothetical protein EGJ57_21280 [Brucella anthropi]UYT54411.1 hypothetical protein OHI65_08545 [Brucella sp. MAB-22]
MRAVIGFSLIFFVLPGSAFAYCSKPSAPSCASSFGSFDDEWEFDRCKREMESYQSEVEDFAQCVQRQAKDDIDEAVSEYEDAVSSFNRRARQ